MSYDPNITNGTNASTVSAISQNGVAEPGVNYTVPARCGVAVSLERGQQLEITNPSGHQVCDFWAFIDTDSCQYMSMSHTRTHLKKAIPEAGDTFVTNLREPIIRMLDCSQPSVHDTLIACCDQRRYQDLGCIEYHDNCADNLRLSVHAIGYNISHVPDPLNLWMNVPIEENSKLDFSPPISAAGDRVVLQAESKCIAVMSACPQDITAVNGEGTSPGELSFRVLPPS